MIRVIGVGCEARGDDAVGLLVARLLRPYAHADVEVCESAGDAGGLLDRLEGAERVVLVDAARGDRPAGTVERLPAGIAPRSTATSTHGLGLAEALDLAGPLGLLPPLVQVYVVYGRRFEPGPVSDAVVAGAERCAERIRRDELDRTVRS